MTDLRFFDPSDQYVVAWRNLPHWCQAGTVCFMTWRTADSMPKPVVQRWEAERAELLRQHHIDSAGDWRAALNRLPAVVRQKIKWTLTERWDSHLDNCHGRCVLKRPELGQIVADSLCSFDGERYVVTDFVVMPNHIHLLVAFLDEDTMLKQVANWKRYTARTINVELKDKGHFWQEEDFDHLVRSPEHFDYYRRYIADNPIRAHLKDGEWILYSAPM